MAKKKQNLSPEELLEQALVPECEWPYGVPENWIWVRLGSMCRNVQYGYTAKASNQDIGPRMLRITDIQDDYVEWNTVPYCEISDNDFKKFKINKNDIMIARTGATTGKSFLVEEEMDSVFASYLIRVGLKKEFSASYLYQFMHSDLYWNQIMELSQGIAQPGVNASKLQSLHFPLPPLAEQQRIVDRIESLFEKLDQAKGLIQDALDSFENRKAAILHKAFSGELTKRWREDNGIGMESWEEKTLGEIIKVSSGQGLTSQNMNPVGRIPVFGGNGVTGYHDKSTVNIPTIVIGRVGFYCGSVHFINEPAWVTDNALIVKFNEKQINIIFLYWLLSHTDLRENDSSTAQPVISGSKIYPIIVKLPPYSEQQEIVTIIESVLAKEQSAKEFCDIVESINLMKKSILARAFRGELGTNNLDEYSSLDLVKTIVMEDNTTSQNPPNSSKGKKTFEENVNMKKTIFEVLSEHKRVTPEKLKILSGINNIDVFYAELKTLVDNGEVIEIREREESFLEVNIAGR